MTVTVTTTEINEPGVVGLFARPDTAGPWPAVVAFGGSSGGLGPAVGWAPALASEGFAVLAVAYFAAPGLPSALVDIEVEVVERAVMWLFAGGHVAGKAVGVMGMSRGSELALLAGVLLDRVGPIVALAPSGISWCGLGPGGPVDAAAWAFRGEPIPYAAMIGGAAPPTFAAGPIALRPMFDAALAAPTIWAHAEIPVERVSGSILLVSGEDDAMWPSTPMAELIARRALDCGFPHRVVHLHYPSAGHTSGGVPDSPGETTVHHPLTGVTYALGGTLEGNAAARTDSWPQIIDFLRAELSPPGRKATQ
jgi:dienelactone hydrolase